MHLDFKQLKWGRVLISAGLVIGISNILMMLIVAVYAFILAIKAMGAPDQRLISQFAEKIAPLSIPIFYIILTFFATLWANRKLLPANMVHGLIIGFIVIIFAILLTLLFGWSVKLTDIIFYLLILGSGWVTDRFCRYKYKPA